MNTIQPKNTVLNFCGLDLTMMPKIHKQKLKQYKNNVNVDLP